MKTPHVSGHSGRNGKGRRQPTVPAIPLKVFIGYADVVAARRAMGTIGDTVRTSGRACEIQPMLWRFAQLASSHWKDRSITAALEADVVVLASTTPSDVSTAIEQWVNDLLHANRGRRVTIVSIAGGSDAWTISVEQPIARAQATTSSIPISAATSEELVA